MSKTQIEMKTLSQDVFDQLLGDDVPDSTAKATDLIGATPTEDPEGNTPEKDVPVEGDQEDPKKIESKEDKPVEFEKDLETLLGEKKPKEEGTDKDIEDLTGSFEDIDTSNFFKAQAQGLVERGLWMDFEELNDENFEWNEENYGKLIEAQAKWKAEEYYNQFVESTGPYGKAIFDFINSGGNPEDIISIFQEMQEIDAIDKSTEDGKLTFLKRYYVDELGWPESKFKRDSESWIDNGVLDEEVLIVDEKLQSTIQKKAEMKRREAEAYKLQQEEAQLRFAQNIESSLQQRSDITNAEKSEILSDLLTYDQRLPDGRVVNRFTLDFMKLQADPASYIDLVMFVKNPARYNSSKEKLGETKANKKTWNLIKGNGSIDRRGGSSNSGKRKPQYKGTKVDYRSLLNS